ncbi:MAG TPA: carboxymuconolactone decarboxylase family protein, partial [Bryobacteraceae bacterium]|nr:carboxymuconolactone decarboxylase family protein [Bryobacteraceae bacterium]
MALRINPLHLYPGSRENQMEPRIKTEQVAPEALKAMLGLEDYVRNSGLEHPLLELAKMRASQLNGCAYCIDMHSKD